MEVQPPQRSFWCFISYRHADNKEPGRQWATWLHQQIETYEVPSDLVGTVNGRGDTLPERIFPVFRDEDELPADADLSSPIYRALDASKFLVVLCSPRAVQSSYVADEILYYKKIGRANRVLAAVLEGDPKDSFPVPLRHPVDEAGNLIETERAEPIAADFRLLDDTQGWTTPEAYRQALQENGGVPKKEIERLVTDYKARLELGKLKIIAGVLGLPLGTLTQRDKAYQLEKERRRARIFRRVTAAMSVLLLVAVAAGVIASLQKREAETQRHAAVTARDAEAAQRALAETRRAEADTARGVAETRRVEADQARGLAEERRVESEARLARSNIQLADRLTREGNTRDAIEALWQIPESERQWEWGYLLGRAYPEASLVRAVGAATSPQGACVDAKGRRAAFWPQRGPLEEGEAKRNSLRWCRITDEGAVAEGGLPLKHGVVAAAWSRSGVLAFLDGPLLRVVAKDGRDLGQADLAGEDEGPEALAFIDPEGTRVVVKQGETWRLIDVSAAGFQELAQVPEASESERFCALSPDGRQWIAMSIDTGGTLYDRDGHVVDRFQGMWQAKAAFGDDGTVAVASISGAVTLRDPDGKRRDLAEGGDVIQHQTNGVSVCWQGRKLYVRTIHAVRFWDLRLRPPAGREIPASEWEIPESTDMLAVGKTWMAVSLVNGSILIAPTSANVAVDSLQGHEGRVAGLEFAFDDCLASVGEDGSLRHWMIGDHTRIGTAVYGMERPLFKDKETWPEVAKEPDDAATIPPAGPGRPHGTTVKVASPDKLRFASTGAEAKIRIWKGDGTEAVLVIQGPGTHGESLAFSRDGRKIGAGFFTAGQGYDFQKEWVAEPWTRAQLGIDAAADWKKAYEAGRTARFREGWKKRLAGRAE